MTHQSKILDATPIRALHAKLHLSSEAERGCGSRVAEADPRWFVFQSHAQAERWAECNLSRQGYEVFVPLVTERRRDPVLKTMTHKVEVPCFPGYGFVRFCRFTDPWRPIVSTRGVRRLFCTASEQPIPVPRGQIERMIAEADARRILSTELPPFAAGSDLVVTSGPFTDREGVCTWSSETRTRLLMQVLGAEVVVEVARGAVRAR